MKEEKLPKAVYLVVSQWGHGTYTDLKALRMAMETNWRYKDVNTRVFRVAAEWQNVTGNFRKKVK